MPKKPDFSWPLMPDNDPESPAMLTAAEMAEMRKILDPLLALLDAYMDGNPETWTFDAMQEALARAMQYLDDIERDIDADLAAEDADA